MPILRSRPFLIATSFGGQTLPQSSRRISLLSAAVRWQRHFPNSGGTPTPVSYTHLRAHETGAYL
eukprot:258793-Pyramimonas_sp.AAC.1